MHDLFYFDTYKMKGETLDIFVCILPEQFSTNQPKLVQILFNQQNKATTEKNGELQLTKQIALQYGK